jgi:hypothetical protein
VKEYLTGAVVAYCSLKADAIALIRSTNPNEPRLIVEKI